jgi:hypothetical protein
MASPGLSEHSARSACLALFENSRWQNGAVIHHAAPSWNRYVSHATPERVSRVSERLDLGGMDLVPLPWTATVSKLRQPAARSCPMGT